jgi:hypothetical protein
MGEARLTGSEYEKILGWCLGHQEAAKVVWLVAEASQIADDIVDAESENPSFGISRILLIAFVELPTNKFWQANQHWYVPLLSAAILKWNATNEWAESDERKRRVFAYAYRFVLEQIVYVTAFILGGTSHALKVIDEMQDFYHTTDPETFETWEHENEQRRRRRRSTEHNSN